MQESLEKVIKKQIEVLEEKYKFDKEALEEIGRAKETIAYYESKNELDKAQAHANHLERFLHDWY